MTTLGSLGLDGGEDEGVTPLRLEDYRLGAPPRA